MHDVATATSPDSATRTVRTAAGAGIDFGQFREGVDVVEVGVAVRLWASL
ncbi:hypothetical protein N7U49_45615 [Streptomyces sp. AD2-2]|nr:hypothetical protein N7U49_45615 [Streptomyces sp. AD2-2]